MVIHELSEEDCLKHFETLRIGIELILDERIEQCERERKIAAAKAAINKAVAESKLNIHVVLPLPIHHE